MESIKLPKVFSSFTLRVMAMVLMVMDHLWASMVIPQLWLNTVGRLCFPIFAFLLAEGFFKTGNRKKYLKRMFLFALIAEIPFNLFAYNGPIYPFHQNVMFTFCIAIILMMWLEWAKTKNIYIYILCVVGAIVGGFLLGFATMVDYYGYGILSVLIFYFTRDKKWGWIVQALGIWYINWVMIGGMVFPVTILGHEVLIPQQGLAVLSLIPIWMYNGRHGYTSKGFRYFCYAFYPGHMMVLYLLRLLLN